MKLSFKANASSVTNSENGSAFGMNLGREAPSTSTSDGLHGRYEVRASPRTSGGAFTMRARFRYPVFSLFVITLGVRLMPAAP
jgi:hypothetical protein